MRSSGCHAPRGVHREPRFPGHRAWRRGLLAGVVAARALKCFGHGQGCQVGTRAKGVCGEEAGSRIAPRGVGRPGSIDRRRRPRRNKTALVLGGGGFTGGVYEIGALRALDLLAVNSTVNQFDVYLGTSAGSFIAALCANGVTPEEMMRVVTRQGKAPFKDIDIGDLLQPQPASSSRARARCLPLRTLSLARQVISQSGAVSLMDVLLGLADGLPSGLYTGAGIEGYLHKVLCEPGRTDDFRDLACELYLTATDLDTCERIVFGADGTEDVPISTAVRASGALPMVYAPVRDQRPGADRRRDRLDDQPRHRGRGRRAPRDRDQPDRAVCQRLRRNGQDAARDARAAGLRHGLSRRSATRRSSWSPTSACTSSPSTGRSAIRAWISC